MSHRFFVESTAIADSDVRFTAEQAHQLRNVLRLRPGDRVRVFDGLARFDRLVELTDAKEGRVVGRCEQAPEPRTCLVAYPALLQRDKFESVIQKLTELGTSSIVPVLTSRAQVRELVDERRLARWRSIVREATEQCGRGVLPKVWNALPLVDALTRATRDGTAIMAHEREHSCSLREALTQRRETVSIFVGPEGGYTPAEVEAARATGAKIVTLGPRILRTETASPVLAALVLHELGDLSSQPS